MTNKFYFDPQSSSTFWAIKSKNCTVLNLGNIFAKIFLGLFLLSLLWLSLNLFPRYNFSWSLDYSSGVGFALLFFAIFLISKSGHFFLETKLKRLGPSVSYLSGASVQRINLAKVVDYRAGQLIVKLFNKEKQKHVSLISSLSFGYSLLSNNSLISFVFSRAGLDWKEVKNLLKEERQKEEKEEKDPDLNLESILIAAFQRASKKNHQKIFLEDLLSSWICYDPFLNKILLERGLRAKDMDSIIEWFEFISQEIEASEGFWKRDNLKKIGSIATSWAAGYTLMLDRYSTNWTRLARRKGFYREILGHQSELEGVENILVNSQKNNVLLVGQPGSGRKNILLALAGRSFWGTTLEALRGKRILELNLNHLIAQTSSGEEVELALDQCFQEVITAGNVILVINDLERFVGETTIGTVDISGILSKYLESPKFQVVAITSPRGLRQKMEKKTAFINLFQKIEITPPSAHQTLRILELHVPRLEAQYRKFILYPTLKKVVEHSARYFQEKPFPQKAIDLLNSVLVYSSRYGKGKIVSPQYVDQVVERKTEIPVSQLSNIEKDTLLNLEGLIHQKIINQDQAVKKIALALRRTRAEIASAREKPMGTFLFLGPTGVGKTETAKTLADIYFGSRKKLIRLDMSEFQNPSDVAHLIGSNDFPGILTTKVREDPFSLILLDEIEKAHPKILNLFLTVLDEGYLSDRWGRKVSFLDTIIIATSNAGAEIIRKNITQNEELDLIKEKLLNHLFENNIFRPEFLNRFDAIVVFKTLTQENLLNIAQLLLEKLKENLNQKKGIELIISEALKKKIVELSYDPVFGAREMKRIVQDKVESAIAQAFLAGKIKRGEIIEIDTDSFAIKKVE